MKGLGLSRLATFASIVVIAACSRATEFPGLPYAPRATVTHLRSPASPMTYSVLYSFDLEPDGTLPFAGVIDVNGTFYGTTRYGGKYGLGTVFYIKKGKEATLYSFQGLDGANPAAGLLDVNGTLYGTTQAGGAYYTSDCFGSYISFYSCGTVFSITTGGKETLLHSFGNGNDGRQPYAGLIDVKGTLYGTTQDGGKYGDGIVFSVTTTGTEKMLHSFGGSDGASPTASLIAVDGTLYGTTYQGGTYGGGTVYSVPRKGGSDTVLHNFGHGTDGANPYAGLIDVSGTLYGTTQNGGTYLSVPQGTVFAITTAGKNYKVLLDFNLKDGSYPSASLTHVNDTLYGTTAYGGAYGFGTVFSIPKYGTEKVLHNFGNGIDGQEVFSNLLNVSGTLYGTTVGGGQNGNGTVFQLTP